MEHGATLCAKRREVIDIFSDECAKALIDVHGWLFLSFFSSPAEQDPERARSVEQDGPGAAVWFDAGGILRGGRAGLRNRSADSGGATGERPWREPPACVAADLSHTSSMGSGYRDGIGARMDGGIDGSLGRACNLSGD